MTMNETLMLPTSLIFDNSTLIDQIRQTYIDLDVDPTVDEVQVFLESAQKYLDKDLDIKTANELFTTIISCFMHFPTELLPILDEFLKKAKFNANYIFLVPSIIFNLTEIQSQLNISDYQTFVNDTLKEILPQINNNDLIIFNHKIPTQLKTNLILNLLLISNLTEQIVSDYFPFIFLETIHSSNIKFHLLIQKLLDLHLNRLLPQTAESNNELSEFIKTKNFASFSKLSDPARSLIESAVIYSKSKNKTEFNIDTFPAEQVFPFIAVSLILLYEFSYSFPPDFTQIAQKGISILETVETDILDTSIDSILKSHHFIYSNKLISTDVFLQMIELLIKKLTKNEYKAIKINLILTLFYFTRQIDDDEKLKQFLKANENDIFKIIIDNITEINSNKELQLKKLNLSAFDSTMFLSHLQDSSSVDEAIQTVYFIEKLCYNLPKIESFEDISVILLLFINELIQEGKWSDVLIIGQFMKENGGYDELVELKGEEMPDYVKETLFGYIPNENESIDDFLNHILADPLLDQKPQVFNILFNKMIQDKLLLHTYISFMVNRFHNTMLPLKSYLTVFHRMLRYFPNELVNITNQLFYFNESEQVVFKKIDFKLSSLPISESGLSIVSKLFKIIEEQKDSLSYQPFYCLRAIGGAFPFLFSKNPQQVIDLVMPTLDKYICLYNSEPTKEQFEEIKTVYSCLSFFLSTLQSSIVLDYFVNWLFTNITTLSNSQILAFIIILRLTYSDSDIKLYMQAWINKKKFFDTLGILLNKTLEMTNELEKFYIRLNIFFFLEEAYSKIPKLINLEVVHVDELSNVEKPFETVFESYYSTFPCLFMLSQIKFSIFSQKLINFMSNIDSQREFYLSFDVHNDYVVNPTEYQYNSFMNQLIKCDSIDKEFIPEIDHSFTADMVRYILSQPVIIYNLLFDSKIVSLVPDLYDLVLNVFEKLGEMLEQVKNDHQSRNIFRIDEYVAELSLKNYEQVHLYSNVFNQLIDESLERQTFNKMKDFVFKITVTEIPLISFLSSFSESLKSFYNENVLNETLSFFNKMVQVIDFIVELSNSDEFKNKLMVILGDQLLDISLSPKCRNHDLIVAAVAFLLFLFADIPVRAIHLIPFLFENQEEKANQVAFDLCLKFDIKQIECIKPVIMKYFEKDTSDGDISNSFINLINHLPDLFRDRLYNLSVVLRNLLDKYLKKNSQQQQQQLNNNFDDDNDDDDLNKISSLFNILAPKRDQSMSISAVVEQSSFVPSYISNSNPSFWKIYEDYNELLNNMFQREPLLLDKFGFLLNYPELISFNIRSSYFRKKMKKYLNDSQKQRLILHIDSNDILKSSYEALKDKSPEDILSQLNVVFDGGKTVDHGGPTCDWLNKLSKEIFNPKSSYFQLFNKNMNYQPLCLSSKIDGYLNFFNFAGQIVARALMEGVCIDAHLTTSFIKQILHRAPKIDDLEDVEPEIYTNLQWFLATDVNPLEMVFETYDESKENPTVELIPGGSEIMVTNDNIKQYVELMYKYILTGKIEKQIAAFVEGFGSLIPHKDIRIFTPNELDLLICGVPEFDVEDFINHTVIQEPYTVDSPVIKFYFSAIRKWENQRLVKLLQFITGCSRVTSNGFEEFCEIAGRPITINSGGEKKKLPQAHTCVNTLSLPQYESEEELDLKLKMALDLCDSFEII